VAGDLAAGIAIANHEALPPVGGGLFFRLKMMDAGYGIPIRTEIGLFFIQHPASSIEHPV
jgi:hypothetical protein